MSERMTLVWVDPWFSRMCKRLLGGSERITWLASSPRSSLPPLLLPALAMTGSGVVFASLRKLSVCVMLPLLLRCCFRGVKEDEGFGWDRKSCRVVPSVTSFLWAWTEKVGTETEALSALWQRSVCFSFAPKGQTVLSCVLYAVCANDLDLMC